MNNWEDIDRLSRDALGGWSEPPPAHIAARIGRRMFWYNLWKFKIVANLKYFIPSAAVITGLTAFFFYPAEGKKTMTFTSVTTAQRAVKEIKASVTKNSNTITIIEQNKKNTTAAKDCKNSSSHNSIQNKGEVKQTVQNTLLKNNTRDPKQKISSTPALLANQKAMNANLPEITTNDAQRNMLPGESNSEETFISRMAEEQRDAFDFKTPTLPHSMLAWGKADDAFSFTKKQISRRTSKPQFGMHFSIAPVIVKFTGLQENISSKNAFPSGTIEIGLSYNIKKFFVETGLQYSYLQTKESSNNLPYNPHTFFEQQFEGQQLMIDTSAGWHYLYVEDSVIHFIDSTWEVNYDSSYNDLYSTVTKKIYDTLKGKSWKTSISIVEIPLAVGYRFFALKTEFSIKGGILVGFITRTGGYSYNSESPEGMINSSEIYSSRDIQFSYFIGGSVSRNISEQWSLELSPYWRSSINGLKAGEGIPPRKYSAWGIGVGLRYEF